MRQAFTLIELMIVIAIIAIIAAIAIPNLLESRVTAQESAAATALRSGILPAEVQFQAGGYCDLDSNGVGTYSVDGIATTVSGIVDPFKGLSGSAGVGPQGNISLTLLSPAYGNYTAAYSSSAATASTYTSGTQPWPLISGYLFKTPITPTAPSSAGTTDGTGEKLWGTLCFPSDDTQGRKFFMINQAGNIYMSKPTANAYTGAADTGGQASSVMGTNAFGTGLNSAPVATYYLPYKK